VKGAGLAEGIEIFPRHDQLKPGEFGNAIRGPLGIHRGANRRYWFYGADHDLGEQLSYLKRLRKVTEAELKNFIAGKSLPASTGAEAREPLSVRKSTGSGNREFGILDHLDKDQLRTVGRNYVTRCPSCAEGGERSRWR
jgi:hypothetical protein